MKATCDTCRRRCDGDHHSKVPHVCSSYRRRPGNFLMRYRCTLDNKNRKERRVVFASNQYPSCDDASNKFGIFFYRERARDSKRSWEKGVLSG